MPSRTHKEALQMRKWLMDTGCPYDLTSRKTFYSADLKTNEPAVVTIFLNTANGLTSCDQVIPHQIGPLGVVATPYVMGDSPDVLTIGYRCVELGYDFHWKPYSLQHVITTPEGKEIDL